MESNKTLKAIGVDGMIIYDVDCVSCLRKGVVLNGQYHCKYCGVMCEECAVEHQKLPRKGHWAIKLKHVVQHKPAPTFKSFTKCETHSSEKIGGYCIDCGEVMCAVCLDGSHAGCATVTIDKMCGTMSREKDTRTARLELEDLRVRNNKLRKTKMDEMKYLSKQADDFMQKVIKSRKAVLEMFDNLLESIVRDKNAFCNAEAKLIDNQVVDSKKLGSIFDSARQKLNEAYRTGNETNLWIAIKKLEGLVAYYDKVVVDLEIDKCDVTFEFTPSESLVCLLQEKENIGKMKVSSSRLHLNETHHLTWPDREQTSFVPKLRHMDASTGRSSHFQRTRRNTMMPELPTLTVSQEKQELPLALRPLSRSSNRSKSMDTINLRPKKLTSKDRTTTSIYSDRPLVPRLNFRKRSNKVGHFDEDAERQIGKEFGEMQGSDIKLAVIGKKEISVPEESIPNSITGIAFLRNGRLVLSDYNNRNLKLYTSDFNLVKCLFLEERPWDVTQCMRTEIAVSFPFVNTIELYETGSDFKSKGNIMVDRKCHGLAFSRQDKLMYVACGDGLSARLQAYSLDGFIRRVIIPEEGIFREPSYLTISNDGARLFVSDLDNGIVGFDTRSGSIVFRYRSQNVRRYWGITTDLRGHVFVLTTDPDCLYVMMGEHNGQLLTTFEGDQKVCAVCFDPVTNSLVVSRWKSEEIEKFRVVYK